MSEAVDRIHEHIGFSHDHREQGAPYGVRCLSAALKAMSQRNLGVTQRWQRRRACGRLAGTQRSRGGVHHRFEFFREAREFRDLSPLAVPASAASTLAP